MHICIGRSFTLRAYYKSECFTFCSPIDNIIKERHNLKLYGGSASRRTFSSGFSIGSNFYLNVGFYLRGLDNFRGVLLFIWNAPADVVLFQFGRIFNCRAFEYMSNQIRHRYIMPWSYDFAAERSSFFIQWHSRWKLRHKLMYKSDCWEEEFIFDLLHSPWTLKQTYTRMYDLTAEESLFLINCIRGENWTMPFCMTGYSHKTGM